MGGLTQYRHFNNSNLGLEPVAARLKRHMTYPHLRKRRHVSIQLRPTLTLICCPFFPPAFVEQPLFAPFGRSRNDWTSYFDAQLNCCH